jgi:hypothetical protein
VVRRSYTPGAFRFAASTFMRLLSFRILPLLFAAGLGVVAPLAFSTG